MRLLGRLLLAAGPVIASGAIAACSSTAGDPGGSSGVHPGDDGASSGDGGSHSDGPLVGPDGAPLPEAGVDAPGPPPRGDGRVTLRLPDGSWHRIVAKLGSASEDVSAPMSKISGGSDDFVNTSKDGDWLVQAGNRFACLNGGCVGLFAGDGATGSEVKPQGKSIKSFDARPAVASGGALVVYPASGPHKMDLYAVKREGAGWGTPVLLTGASTFEFHHDVAVMWDGSRAVFDCGADAYAQPPTSMCEVQTDGTGFHVVLGPADGPDHGDSHALHHPDYTPQGDFVFEADWPSEQIWKLVRGATAPSKLSPANQTDDNSPCVLPDGRIASLWLGRPGNPGSAHELKVMNADGSGSIMVLTGTDIVDVGMGCGN